MQDYVASTQPNLQPKESWENQMEEAKTNKIFQDSKPLDQNKMELDDSIMTIENLKEEWKIMVYKKESTLVMQLMMTRN